MAHSPGELPIRRFVLASLLWLGVGVAMGAFFATGPGFSALKYAGHDFELVFASVHSHINLLGWLSNALFAVTFWLLPRASGRPLYSPRLAAWQWWLLNVGLAGMMVALFAGAAAGSAVYTAGRAAPDPGTALFGPGNAYLPHEALLGVLRWGIPFAVLVVASSGAFLLNVWLTYGLRPSLARPANRLRERAPTMARWLGIEPVREEASTENPALKWFFKLSAVWLVAGLLLGGLYGSPPMFRWLKAGGFDFESMFASVHSHMTVMGWLGNGLFAALYGLVALDGRPFPARAARLHLRLYNIGLAGLLALLTAGAYAGRAAYVGATGSLTEAQRFYPLEVSLEALRPAIPIALLFGAGLLVGVAALWRRGPPAPPGRFIRSGLVWLSAGLLLEGLLSLDPAFFWQKRSGHEFEFMEVAVKDHMVMLGGLSGIAFGLLYLLAPRLGQTPRPRLAALHLVLWNVGLAGFLLFYGLGGYAGGFTFQTASNPYGPAGYLPYIATLDLTRFGVPFAVLLTASLFLFILHMWRCLPPRPRVGAEP